MATQYTDILKLALPVQGELTGTWGTTVNDEITTMVEQAIAGLVTIDVWAADSHTLSIVEGAVSESRAAILRLTDTTVDLSGAGTLITPAQSKVYIVENNTGQVITIKTSAGTGVAIPNTKTGLVFCDGVNVEDGISYLPYSNATSGLTATTVQTAIDEVDADLDALTASLGTASTHNVTASDLDTTADSVLRVGNFGLGTTLNPTLVDFAVDNPSGMYSAWELDVLNFPATDKAGYWLMILCTNSDDVTEGRVASYYVQRIAPIGTTPDPLDPSAGLPPPLHRSWNVSTIDGVASITELLKVGDYGIGFLNYRASVDMNTTFVGGLYSYENTDVNRPNPTGTAGGSYVVNRHGISYFSQTAVDAGSGIMYNRITMADGVTWKAWREHATLAESDTRYLQLTGGTVTGDLTLTDSSLLVQRGSAAGSNPVFLKSHDQTGGMSLAQHRSRGTLAAPTALIDGDIIGGMNSHGYDGTGFLFTAGIRYRVSGTVSTGVVPQKITFETDETNGDPVERMVIAANGFVGIGTTTPTTLLDVSGDSTFSNGAFNVYSNSSNNPTFLKSWDLAGGTSLNMKRSRGTDIAPTSLVDNDTVGGIVGWAHDGTEYFVNTSIKYRVDGVTSTGVVPLEIIFETSETDTAGRTERLNIKADGKVGIGTTTPATELHLVGDLTVSGAINLAGSVLENPIDYGLGVEDAQAWPNADIGDLTGVKTGFYGAFGDVTIALGFPFDEVNCNYTLEFASERALAGKQTLSFQRINSTKTDRVFTRNIYNNGLAAWDEFYHSGNSVNPLDFGLGDGTAPILTDFTSVIAAGHYRCTLSTVIGGPDTGAFSASVLVENAVDDGGQTFIVKRQTTNSANLLMWLGSRTINSGAITWVEEYNSGNTNFDVFTSSVVGDVIAIGIGATTTTAIVHLPLVSNTAPTSLTIPAFTFKLSRMTDSVVVETGITAGDISLNALSSRRVAKLVISNCTGLVAGTAYELRTENTTSSITVVF